MSGEYFEKDVIADDINFTGVSGNCSKNEQHGDWPLEQREVNEIKYHDILPAANTNKCRSLLRQNSGAVGTDCSGAAVVTINNILSGITNSINRLSEMHGYFDVEKTAAKCSKKSRENDDNENSMTPEISGLIINKRKKDKKRSRRRSFMSINSSTSLLEIQNNSKSKSMKKEDSNRRTSTTSMKKYRIKRLQQLSKLSSAKKSAKVSHKIPGTNNNLVEIYHNVAAKSSESDDNVNSQSNYNKKTKPAKMSLPKKVESTLPSNTSSVNDRKSEIRCPSRKTDNPPSRTLTPIQEQHFDTFESTNFGTDITVFNHNYETPTISSKMKQVARGYFSNYGEKTIPFCVATSTGPSHNIGINIQQVMNIIKNKQPIKGISPTLAHNIGIAAGKLNHDSLSALVSSFGSKIPYNNHLRCPMIKGLMNYQELQEMAKDVIDEVKEEEGEEKEEKDEAETTNQNKNLPSVWTMDPNKHVICTCVPKQGVGFQQIMNRYQQIPSFQNSSTEYAQSIMKRSKQRYKNVKSVYAQYNEQLRNRRDSGEQANPNSCGEGSTYLKGKEKALKGVLLNLHTEFEQLNNRYEELTKSMNAGGDGEMNSGDVKELEQIEKKLMDKEEEIEMVMTLYGEVVNLKQQVKLLRENINPGPADVENENVQNRQNQDQRRRSPGSGVANLSKFLRQIKNFQGRL